MIESVAAPLVMAVAVLAVIVVALVARWRRRMRGESRGAAPTGSTPPPDAERRDRAA